MNIKKIYNKKIEQLAKLFNLSIENAELFFINGLKSLINKETY